ncbi:MAG: ABC transporter permease subunit [Gemmataceae bacterium]
MTFVLVRKFLRDIRLPLAIVCLLVIAYECFWVKIAQRAAMQISPFFSTVAERAGLYQRQIEDMLFSGPGRIVQTMAGGEDIHFERAMDVLSIGYMHPLMLIVFCVWGVGRAASAIAGELGRGTIELLLAQPVPRSRLVLAHFLVDLLVIPIIALSMWAGTALGFQLVGSFEVSPENVQQMFGKLPFKVVVDPKMLATDLTAFGPALANIAALIFAFSGMTIAISAAGRFRFRVLGWAVLLVLVQFIANLIGQLWDTLAFLRPFTAFYYYQPQQIILNKRWTVDLLAGMGSSPVPVNVVAVLVSVGLVGYLIALVIFRRRDLPAPL